MRGSFKLKMEGRLQRSLGLVAFSFLMASLMVSSGVSGTGWSLLPPALAIGMAFLSGQLVLSLLVAVLMGAFLNAYGESQALGEGFLGMFTKSSQYLWMVTTDQDKQLILGFVFFIFSMVHVMMASGGLHALMKSMESWVVGPRSAQLVTALLGCLIFIDDYANTMIVGSSMKKLTDRHRVSREKLAFLVDATSAPIAGVALVSTWIGFEVGLFGEVAEKFSWGVNGYSIFLGAVQFRYYCYLMLFFVFVNILFGRDFGPMKRFENSSHGQKEKRERPPEAHLLCALLPLGFLLTLLVGLMWADGGGFSGDRNIFQLSHWQEVLAASENGIFILFISSVLGYGVSVITALTLSSMEFKKLPQAFLQGLKSMFLPLAILLLAASLKHVSTDLKTGEYIVSVLVDQMSPHWFPFCIFITAALTAFATGTSWGTMAILIPTVSPLAVAFSGGDYSPYVCLCLAAILDGAIMGDHCSPLSDTTIMSSLSTDCDLMNHVKSQMPYSLLVSVLALFFGYLTAGFHGPLALTLPMALFFMVILFYSLKFWPLSPPFSQSLRHKRFKRG